MLVSALACGNAPSSEEPQGVRDAVAYQLAAAADAGVGLNIEFCAAGACKVTLAPQFELDFKVDWTVDLAIPLADTGWLCKLPPNNAKSECIVSASQSARELYIWGPVEAGCNFLWGPTPDGIDAIRGAGCGMCKLEPKPEELGAAFAFNMGFDTSCRCPKAYFAAVPAKP